MSLTSRISAGGLQKLTEFLYDPDLARLAGVGRREYYGVKKARSVRKKFIVGVRTLFTVGFEDKCLCNDNFYTSDMYSLRDCIRTYNEELEVLDLGKLEDRTQYSSAPFARSPFHEIFTLAATRFKRLKEFRCNGECVVGLIKRGDADPPNERFLTNYFLPDSCVNSIMSITSLEKLSLYRLSGEQARKLHRLTNLTDLRLSFGQWEAGEILGQLQNMPLLTNFHDITDLRSWDDIADEPRDELKNHPIAQIISRWRKTLNGQDRYNVGDGSPFRKAADLGNYDAQYKVGKILFDLEEENPPFDFAGNSLQRDDQTAYQLLEKAANQGHQDALFLAGKMLYIGRGVARDHVKALGFFLKAGWQGHRGAAAILGQMFETGQGLGDQNEHKEHKGQDEQKEYKDQNEQKDQKLGVADLRSRINRLRTAAKWYYIARFQEDEEARLVHAKNYQRVEAELKRLEAELKKPLTPVKAELDLSEKKRN